MTRPPVARPGGTAVLAGAVATVALLLGGCAPVTSTVGARATARVAVDAAAGAAAGAPGTAAWAQPPMRLRLIGETAIPRVATDPLLRHLGGISGLDYDPVEDTWYLLSDDRSEHAPARFYTARIRWNAQGLEELRVTGLTPLLQRDGQPYPNVRAPTRPGEPPPDSPDPEALRLDPRTGRLLWSSEGDRPRGLQPFIRWSERGGRFAGELPLPERLRVHPDEPRGARDNLSLEGLGRLMEVEMVDRHTARGDALTAGLIFLRMIPRLEERGVRTLSGALRLQRRRPAIVGGPGPSGGGLSGP